MSVKTIFWNVDTQYDFMRKDGKLYVAGAEGIEGNLERLTKLAERSGIKVVNTADWHNEQTTELVFPPGTPDYVNTFPPHCMQNTAGAEYVPATAVKNPHIVNWDAKAISPKAITAAREILIRKDKFDVFEGNPHTDSIVSLLNPERVVVYGVATNYCVNYAVKGLVERGFEVYAVSDAVKEIPLPGEPQKTLDTWKQSGVKLATTDEIVRMYRK